MGPGLAHVCCSQNGRFDDYFKWTALFQFSMVLKYPNKIPRLTTKSKKYIIDVFKGFESVTLLRWHRALTKPTCPCT